MMNLIICGDFESSPFALQVTPETVVSAVKHEAAKTIGIPKRELVLYFGDKTLPDDSRLAQWGGELRNGAGVLAVANPLRITLQRYFSQTDVNLEAPRLAVLQWTTDQLFEFCRFKGGMPRRIDGKYVFAVQGTVLESGKRLRDYRFLKDDFIVSITFLSIATTTYGNRVFGRPDPRKVHVPASGPLDIHFDKVNFDSKETVQWQQRQQRHQQYGYSSVVRYSHLSDAHREYYYDSSWKLTIQTVDGTKQIVELPNQFFTTIHELRMKVSSDNIRLTHGSTVLEDWDEEGNLMLLCSYPDMHDGATLYQINLTGAIRIKYQHSNYDWQMRLHDDLQNVLDEGFEFIPSRFIFIEDPKRFTVNRLIKVLVNCGLKRSIYDSGGKELVASDDPVSSVEFIRDGYTFRYSNY